MPDTALNATSDILWGESTEWSNITSFNEVSQGQISKGVLHNFLNRANGYAWLDERLPAFTAADYVVAPFNLANGERENGIAEGTLTASTMLYETDIVCEPANVIPTPPSAYSTGVGQYNITNSQGFNLQIGGESRGNGYRPAYATGYFVGYCDVNPPNTSTIANLAFTGPQTTESSCGPPNTSFTFLAIWQNDQKSGADETEGLLAALCKPAYYSQSADVTVSQNQSILSVTRTGERAILDPLSFVHSEFETIVSGINIDQAARVSAMGLGYEAYGTVATVIGTGLALTTIAHSELPQSNNFGRVIETAYKLMFSLAAQTQMSYNKGTTPTSIRWDETVDAVVMVRPFAIVIEVLLGVIAAIASLVFILNARRANKLQSDPHSLAYSMALSSSAASKPLLASLSKHEMATTSQLDATYRDLKFVLREGSKSPMRCVSLLSEPPKQSPPQDVPDVSRGPSEAALPPVAKPAYMEQLSFGLGIPFMVTLAVLIVGLSLLKFFSRKYQGKQTLPFNQTYNPFKRVGLSSFGKNFDNLALRH